MAKIGIISDSHAKAHLTGVAAKMLVSSGAKILLHLGDVNSLAVIDALVLNYPDTQKQVEVHVVFGNTDYEAEEYGRYARSMGLVVDHPVGELEFGDKRLIFTHGHLRYAMQQAVDEGAAYLCYGHTHEKADKVTGGTRMINPGALVRAEPRTVALLDTEADKVEFMVVDANNS